MEAVARVTEVLGGAATLRGDVETWSDLDRIVRAGLPKRSLQLVARRVVKPESAATRFVYSVVPPATFKRRRRLTAEESARTERLARVIARAEALWEDREEAREFLTRPHPLLDGETPLDVSRTELGARRVEQLLTDAENGLPL